MSRPRWSVLGVLALSLFAWALIADGGFRLAHHGRGGLRHAVYAHAVGLAHRLERVV